MSVKQFPPADDLLTPLRHVKEPDKIHGRVMAVVDSRLDVVGPQSKLSIDDRLATFMLGLDEPVLLGTGVQVDVLPAAFTRSAWRHVHERLRIPIPYADRLAAHEHAAVRSLGQDSINTMAAVDDRSALYRYLQTEEGLVLRAVRSSKYLMLDNDAALVAMVKGLQAHELDLWDCEVDADITPDRLRLRVAVPKIAVKAAELLRGYRMPFSMDESRGIHDKPLPGETPPMIWAGLEFTNSETGAGAFQVSPRAVVEICRNGMTKGINFRRAHLGANMQHGEIEWSAETVGAALALITSQVNDAVTTYLTTDYLDNLVKEMMVSKGMDVVSVPEAVKVVQQRMTFSDAETASILNCFTKGADTSVFGLGQAVTAAAQLVDNGDRQAEMELAFDAIVTNPHLYVGAV